MSLELLYSDNIEPLFNELLDNINKDTNHHNPFYSPIILIPNMNLKKWLQINIAKKNNICVNMDFNFLEEGLTKALKKIGSKNNINMDKYIFSGHKENHIYMQVFILSLIKNYEKLETLGPVGEYLKTAAPNERIKKEWQLSEKLTYYFREYEYHRQNIIHKWKENKFFFINDIIENFQKKIYSKIFIEKKIINNFEKKIGKTFITLPWFSNLIFENCNVHEISENIHIFAFSQLSNFHYDLFFKLSEFYHIKIYSLNFLQKYIDTKNSTFRNLENIEITNNQILNPGELDDILKSFALPSLESMILLNEKKSNYKNIKVKWLKNFNSDKNKKNLLNHLQNKILGVSDADIKMSQDTSLQIIGCKSKIREIETVYNSILYNLLKNKNLQLTDIAVLVPDMNKYKNIIANIFSKNPTDFFNIDSVHGENFIPFNLTDSSADIDSIFGNAVIDGLKLASGNFTRKEVFNFVMNPCFLKSQKIEKSDSYIWLEWIDKLNIFHTYSNNNGDDNNINSWEHGLRRMRFGRIMENIKSDEILLDYKHILPYYDIKTNDKIKLNNFISSIENLFSFIKKFHNKNTGKEWKNLLNIFIDQFLEIPEDYQEEKIILYKLLESFEKLELFDIILNKKIELNYIIEFIKSNLSSIPSKIGKYLTDGITISSLIPARPIPFKIIYVVGMNEGEFPGLKDKSTLDLRNHLRLIGDVSKTEANTYLFLETLLSVKEKLYITYVSQDIQKDKELYPSMICNKLINYIEKYLITDNFQIVQTPLNSESTKYLSNEINKDIQDVFVNYFYPDRFLSLLYIKNSANSKIQNLINNEYNKIQDFYKTNINKKNRNEIIFFTLNDLASFLINPVEAKIKKIFNLYEEDDDDKALKEDEPFYSDSLLNYKFQTETLKSFLSNKNKGKSLDYFDIKYQNDYLKGSTPKNIYKKIDKENIIEKIENRIENNKYGITEYLNTIKGNTFYKKIIINSDSGKTENKDIMILHDLKIYFIINGNTDEISIKGEHENIYFDHENSIMNIPIITTGSNNNSNVTKHVIKPFFFYLLLLMISSQKKSIINITGYTLIITTFFKDKSQNFSLNITADEAEKYIRKIINNFFDPDNFDLLPFNVILKNRIFPPADRHSYKEILENEIELEKENNFSNYKYQKILDIINAKVPGDAFEKVNERYKYFMKK